MAAGSVSREKIRVRRALPIVVSATALAAALAVGATQAAPPAAAGPGRTIGLVLTSWDHALQQTPDMKECPQGLQPSERKQLEARKDMDKILNTYGGVGLRGPNGESNRQFPMLTEDVLPFSELQTPIGYGMNLDGTQDGKATPKSCTHEKFTSPEGEKVDNQMARVLGCTYGWRKDGFNQTFMGREFELLHGNRVLVEITGVDDEKNDPEVEVAIYKGLDRLVSTAPGKFVPFLNQRIDTREPRFAHTTRGRIVDGVLITDPIPRADMSVTWLTVPAERRLKDMRLRLKLTDTGAEGYVAGYEDTKIWWNLYAKTAALPDAGGFSASSIYRAMVRYADGFPDPASGQCTAISAQYKVTAVRALIPHAQGEGQVAQASGVVR